MLKDVKSALAVLALDGGTRGFLRTLRLMRKDGSGAIE